MRLDVVKINNLTMINFLFFLLIYDERFIMKQQYFREEFVQD